VADATSNRKPRNRWAILASLVAFLSCCGCPLFFSLVPFNGVLAWRLKADMEKRLPDGSSREQAEAWFASHGFVAGDIVKPDGRRVGLMAIIPSATLIDNGEVQVYVYFDDNGKVRKRIVRRIVFTL
jgi:hypothetical protein